METISFDKLLLKTAFCCMASDGNIDSREISLIISMFENSKLFEGIKIHEEINNLVNNINAGSKGFITDYFDLLNRSSLTESEELTLIDFAIQTIKADDQIEYAEIKFFKNIRHRLKVSDDNILAVFPDLEQFLEEDIVTESFLEKITSQYFEAKELPKFEILSSFDTGTLDNLTKNE